MITALGGLLDATGGLGFWGTLASAFSTAAAMLGTAASWANQRARRPELTEYEKVEQMVRRPVVWTMRHPLVSLKRKVDRRRQSI